MIVVAKDAERGHVEIERHGRRDVELHPGDRNGSKEVAVRESKDPAVDRGRERGEVQSPVIDLLGRLTARTSILVELPIRSRLVDLFRGLAFVVAVIDLAKQCSQLGFGEAGNLGSAPGALKRTRVDSVEMDLAQAVPQVRGLVLTVRGQRQIGAPCVAAAKAPFGLAVADQVDLGAQAGLPIISGLPERRDRLALSMTAPARTR